VTPDLGTELPLHSKKRGKHGAAGSKKKLRSVRELVLRRLDARAAMADTDVVPSEVLMMLGSGADDEPTAGERGAAAADQADAAAGAPAAEQEAAHRGEPRRRPRLTLRPHPPPGP
jgi:hypothetical protein